MNFSKCIKSLAPSATFAVHAKAAALKAEGRDIISMAAGEPDFVTPGYICEAAKQAIDEGFTKYVDVAGMPELRRAVAGYFGRLDGITADEKNAIITNGGKHALYNLCLALLDPGDEVIIPAPYWVTYPEMVGLVGGKPVIVPATSADGFKVTPHMLDKRRSGKTKMMILNAPSNPTGACYTQAEIDALAQWTLDNGIILVSDEIYDQLVYAPAVRSSLAPWWNRHQDSFVICGGLSKTFAMMGWRVGYTLGSAKLIKALSGLQGQTTAHISTISQRAALAALTGGLDSVFEMRRSFERRRDLAYTIISSWKDVVCPKPDGAFYIFPDMHRRYTRELPDSTSLCTDILEKTGVAVVPGKPFGDDNCMRMSYAMADAVLADALGRITEYLKNR